MAGQSLGALETVTETNQRFLFLNKRLPVLKFLLCKVLAAFQASGCFAKFSPPPSVSIFVLQLTTLFCRRLSFKTMLLLFEGILNKTVTLKDIILPSWLFSSLKSILAFLHTNY